MRPEVGELLLELEDVTRELMKKMAEDDARLCGALILLATEISECREELAAIRVRL